MWCCNRFQRKVDRNKQNCVTKITILCEDTLLTDKSTDYFLDNPVFYGRLTTYMKSLSKVDGK